MTLIENLNWRYATKKFNPNKSVEEKDIGFLKEVVRLTPMSYGLQTFKVAIITDAKQKNALRKVSFNQPQIEDASHIFVFCNYREVSNEFIQSHIDLTAKERNLEAEKLRGYGDFMKKTIGNLNKEEVNIWTEKQVYMAMSNLLTACAELKIDACPIEGFVNEEYDNILNLNGVFKSSVVVAVGYRSDDDASQFSKKVRMSKADLFI